MEVLSAKGNFAMVLRVRDPDRVRNAVRNSRVLSTEPNGLHRVAAQWTLKNSRTLVALGLDHIAAPIEHEYDWPGFNSPYRHQIQTAAFLAAHPRAYVFSDAGTGKTKAALWAADYLMRQGIVSRVLIVCPMSIMREAWANEVFHTVMHRTVGVCHGSREKRASIVKGEYEFVVINYDGLNVVNAELQSGGFDLIIVDEANAFKNVATRRWKSMAKLVTPSTQVWAMTATPASQSPEDAYGLAKLLTPDRVPKFFGRWREMVMQQVSRFKWQPKSNAVDVVNHALRPAIRFRKSDCLELPEMIYQTRFVPLTPQQSKVYKELKKQLLVEADGHAIRAVHAAAAINKLLQLSCGVVYADGGNAVRFDGSNRVQVLLEVLDQAANKVIVFVPFRHVIDVVAEEVQRAGYSTEIVHGGVGMNARSDIFNRFQTTDTPRVLIIQPQSASHGLTLTAADTIVWFGPVASV
jgi:SNF2 family DNA or RNA helicase